MTPIAAKIKNGVRMAEEWWFDRTRSVKTAGYGASPTARQVVGVLGDGQVYVPVRVAGAHVALRDLPIKDMSGYLFLDMGSGKGRMLFVAAEYPFRKVQGVEYETELHELAKANIRTYRHKRRRCGGIESVLANAAEFDFPDGDLVVYLFNPFGEQVMAKMLANLKAAIQRTPRHVVVLLMYPELSYMFERMPELHLYRKTRRYHIYQTMSS
ncbi:MAG: class I SAM-dependent methyltransferase [Acidobacteriota bacterium]|jgi:SAM-dependent methyltransferase|nr:class I SAM-dependent methyltransferase [Acidobacteriota bacterium]